jgi:protein-S-isoprenylcysteine O-methyltransferase Ste14
MTKLLGSLFVWLGGAVFVGSLALTSWAYAFWFGRDLPWQGWGALLVDTTLLSIFALHHSLFARQSMKTRLARLWPEHLLRSSYVWIASLLLILVCLLWRTVGGEVYRAPMLALVVAHALVQLTGVGLIARSVRTIDPLELAGIRPGRSPTATALQVTGPYRLVRHPLYLGWMMIVFGPWHLTGDRLAFAVITSIYLIVAIPWEERLLEDTFGAAYARYKRQVRWRVVPGIY